MATGPDTRRAAPPALASRLRGVERSPVRDLLALTERSDVLSFAGGLPAPELFDVAGIREAFAAVLADGRAARSLQYSTTEGDPALRDQIARRLLARGLPTDPDRILVTTGSQQALTLIAGALLEPGDTILVEDPSYLAALQAFRLAGADPVPVPCDDDGIDTDALEELVVRHRPKVLYVVPTFHNPTGRTTTEARRDRIAEIAERHGLWIVEDDPYGELGYADLDGDPAAAGDDVARPREAPTPIALRPAASDRTLYLSTVSKVAAPGLRIGWVRSPPGLYDALTVAKQAADLHTSTVDQAATAHWLARTDLDRHLDGVRHVYRDRRDALLDGLATALPAGSSVLRPEGGMFVWATLPDGFDAAARLPAALAADVAYVPGVPFYAADVDPRTLRLSFVTHPPETIAEGLRRLSGVWG